MSSNIYEEAEEARLRWERRPTDELEAARRQFASAPTRVLERYLKEASGNSILVEGARVEFGRRRFLNARYDGVGRF